MTWRASTEQGAFLGLYMTKGQMFDAMRLRGVSTRFRAAGTNGSAFLYEVTDYGYRRIKADVPAHLQRDGRKIR